MDATSNTPDPGLAPTAAGDGDANSDKDVTVGFSPPNTWSFSPPSVTMRASGKIKLKRAKDQDWAFVSATVLNGGTQFTAETPGNSGATLDIRDEHTSDGSWGYTVTVSLNGTQYTSPSGPQPTLYPPPVIVNAESASRAGVEPTGPGQSTPRGGRPPVIVNAE